MNVTEKVLQYARDKPVNLSAVKGGEYFMRESMDEEVQDEFTGIQ